MGLGDVWGIPLLPGGQEFLCAGDLGAPGVVLRFDLETGKELAKYDHEGTAFRLDVHPDGSSFLSTDGENSSNSGA